VFPGPRDYCKPVQGYKKALSSRLVTGKNYTRNECGDLKTTLETSVEDLKTTLETSEEDLRPSSIKVPVPRPCPWPRSCKFRDDGPAEC
jgi:hypothetical protein